LQTLAGGNISDPNYGDGIRQFLFEMNDDYTRSAISSAISSKISIYIPYISVQDIQVNASAQDIDDNSLNVKIIYGIPGDVVQEVFDLDVNPETFIGFY